MRLIMPAIHADGVPPGKAAIALSLTDALRQLLCSVEEFDSAVDLHGFAETQYSRVSRELSAQLESVTLTPQAAKPLHDQMARFIGWQNMARRIASLALGDVYEGLRGLPRLLVQAKSIQKHVDSSQFDAAIALFAELFPNADLVRNAAAHPAERSGVVRRREREATPGESLTEFGIRIPGASVLATSNISGDTVFHSNAGRTVTFELTRQSTESLLRVIDLVRQAYEPASRWSLTEARKLDAGRGSLSTDK